MEAKAICVISRQKLSKSAVPCPAPPHSHKTDNSPDGGGSVDLSPDRRRHSKPQVTYGGQVDSLLKSTKTRGPFVTEYFSIS